MSNPWYPAALMIVSGFMAYVAFTFLSDGNETIGLPMVLVVSLLTLNALREFYVCWTFRSRASAERWLAHRNKPGDTNG